MNIADLIDTSTPTSVNSLAELIAQERAFVASAKAAGVSGEAWSAMYALRHAADFLDHAAQEIAKGKPIDALEVVQWFQWGVMKAAEFNALLPGTSRTSCCLERFQR